MSDPIIDLEDVLRRIEGDKELLVELIEIFLEDCPPKLEQVKNFLDQKNVTMLQEVAHSVKGAAANIGAKKMWDTFKEIDAAAKNQDLEPIKALLPRGIQEYDEIKNYFPSLKKELQ